MFFRIKYATTHPVFVHNVISDVPSHPQVCGTSHEVQEVLDLCVGQVKRNAYSSRPVFRQRLQQRYPLDAALSDQGNVRRRIYIVFVFQKEGMRAVQNRGAFLEFPTRTRFVVLKRACDEYRARKIRALSKTTGEGISYSQLTGSTLSCLSQPNKRFRNKLPSISRNTRCSFRNSLTCLL